MKMLVTGLLFLLSTPDPVIAERPNIVWIVIEDASPHIGCYGETAIQTPAIDGLARDGIRFTQAFVTAPVCSASRSAMLSGMYQMTLGAHNHRSQNSSGKGGTSAPYFDSYKVPTTVKLVPELFRDAGYYVTNKSKTDYNFIPNSDLYHGNEWSKAKPDQPIFAQFQLKGGKRRKPAEHVDLEKIKLPPYYADHPVIRSDWASYLESWVLTDNDVAKILADLQQAGRLENTAVFLWTDHGVSHLRGKQFLYEEGIRVPLIVRLPRKIQKKTGAKLGMQRDDIIEHIDIAAASLSIAGLPVPEQVQGQDFLSPQHKPRSHLFAGRDRCDETVDIMRAIRDSRFKYIRNFMSHVPHAQPSQYKDGKMIVQTMRELHSLGMLNEVQARPFATRRSPEELYDLKHDPDELNNLAASADYAARLKAMRGLLYQRMKSERDMGLIPEPILDDIGRQAGSKYEAFRSLDRSEQTQRLINTITAGEQNNASALLEFSRSEDPATRYWAAVWIGVNKIKAGRSTLQLLAADKTHAVRVAAGQAIVKLGDDTKLKALVNHINDPNLLVGMFALRAIEELGERGKPFRLEISAAQKSKYEFSRRIAKRLIRKWSDL